MIRSTTTCIPLVLLGLISVARPVAAGEIVFEKTSADATGIVEAISAWKAAELKRQGGKFQSHGWWPWGLRAFDFDNDGDLDLIASHHGKPGSMILRNELAETGKLRFVDHTRQLGVEHRDLPGADDRPWIWDFDGDGFLDIAGLSDESKPAMIWNRKGKRFEVDPLKRSFRPVSHPVEVTDVNGDGHPDLDGGPRGVHFFDPEIAGFRHDKTPRHPEPANLPRELVGLQERLRATDKKNRFVRVKVLRHFINGYDTLGHDPRPIDLNGDGLTDTILTGQGGYGGAYLGRYVLQTGDGELAHRTKELGLPQEGCPIYFGDLTGDDRPDLLIVGTNTGGLYANTGDGGYVTVENELTPLLRKRDPYLLRAFPADFNNDGRIDLLLSSPRYGRTRIYCNRGDGAFDEILSSRGWDSNPNVICDIDGDGRLDALVGGHAENEIAIFLNKTTDGGHYTRISPRTSKPNPYAIDTVVRVYRAGDLKRPTTTPLYVRKAHWDATPIHVGLGEVKAFDLRIEFPGGQSIEHTNVSSDTNLTVTPDGKLVVDE